VDVALIFGVLGALVGGAGLSGIAVALITRQKPKAERAEVLVDQVQEERARSERRAAILTQLSHEQDVFALALMQHIIGKLPPPPPTAPDHIGVLKQMLIDLDREGKP
jgi:hypothetical protein